MSPDPASAWVARSRPGQFARLRLFCFPHAGGAASIYRPWVEPLSPDIEVCPIQLPGREARIHEPPAIRLTTLVESLTAVMRTKLDIPFVFFGHSMGALTCFELARGLRRAGLPLPQHLFVAASRAPQLPDKLPFLHDRPDPVFINQLAQRYGGIPKIIAEDADALRFFLPIMRADFELCETYRYVEEPKLECPISVFGGTHDLQVSPADLAAWGEQTTRPLPARMFRGDHFFLNSSRTELLSAIAKDLAFR